jgi:hypothetical protein
MDDIIWPGNALKHPSGRPIKFHLKIVTLVIKLIIYLFVEEFIRQI